MNSSVIEFLFRTDLHFHVISAVRHELPPICTTSADARTRAQDRDAVPGPRAWWNTVCMLTSPSESVNVPGPRALWKRSESSRPPRTDVQFQRLGGRTGVPTAGNLPPTTSPTPDNVSKVLSANRIRPSAPLPHAPPPVVTGDFSTTTAGLRRLRRQGRAGKISSSARRKFRTISSAECRFRPAISLVSLLSPHQAAQGSRTSGLIHREQASSPHRVGTASHCRSGAVAVRAAVVSAQTGRIPDGNPILLLRRIDCKLRAASSDIPPTKDRTTHPLPVMRG